MLSLVGTAGKLLVVPDDAQAGVINPRLIRFSFDRERVCPQFFKELFEAAPVQSLLARFAQGGTMGVLNASILRGVSIPLPPLREQQTIAAALSDVDALIGALDRLIAKKRDLNRPPCSNSSPASAASPAFTGSGKEAVRRAASVSRNGYRTRRLLQPIGGVSTFITATSTPAKNWFSDCT